MANNNFPFRRYTDPFIVPVDVNATQFDLPTNFFTTAPGNYCSEFLVVNPNLFWVRFRGSGNVNTGSNKPAGTFVAVTSTTGWLLSPGFIGVYSTQSPLYISALAVACQGIVPGQNGIPSTGILEISYGAGS